MGHRVSPRSCIMQPTLAGYAAGMFVLSDGATLTPPPGVRVELLPKAAPTDKRVWRVYCHRRTPDRQTVRLGYAVIEGERLDSLRAVCDHMNAFMENRDARS